MEDLRWIYVVFAVIYFVAKMIRKKGKPDEAESTPSSQGSGQPGKKPMSFEELIKEFTQEKENSYPNEDSATLRQDDSKRVNTPVRETLDDSILLEGRNRQFADDESKKVYEESIARAEQFHLDYERDEKFKSQLRTMKDDEDSSDIGSELRDMLRGNDAKKAVVLSEILNRKY